MFKLLSSLSSSSSSFSRIFPLLCNNTRNFTSRTHKFRPSSSTNPFALSSFFTPPNELNQIFSEFNRLANSMLSLNNQVYSQFFKSPSSWGSGGDIEIDSGTSTGSSKQLQDKSSTTSTSSKKSESGSESKKSEMATTSETESPLSSGIMPIDTGALFSNNMGIKLDLDEEPDKYILKASVPEFTKDHLKCKVRNGYLVISGEMKQEKKDQHGHFHSTRAVTQSIKLPDNIQEDQIAAKFENGVLNILIPKKEKTETQQQQQQQQQQSDNIQIQ